MLNGKAEAEAEKPVKNVEQTSDLKTPSHQSTELGPEESGEEEQLEDQTTRKTEIVKPPTSAEELK